MNGRQEHNNKIEDRIQKKLIGKPSILKQYSYSFEGKTQTTKEVYLRYVGKFLDSLGAKNLNLIKRTDIDMYMDSIKYHIKDGKREEVSSTFRNAQLAAIKHFFQFLYDNRMIYEDPTIHVKSPKIKDNHEIVSLTPDEIEKIMNNVKNGVGSEQSKKYSRRFINRNLAIISIGCFTGLRCSAITEINIDDLDFEHNTIKVTEKGDVDRIVYFGDKTKEIILNWIKDRNEMTGINTNALFISKNKQRISQHAIYVLLQKYCADIDKHITPHKMRSTCATNLYEKTNDIYLVQEVLGHKNIANTKKYAKMSEEKRRNAADILDKLV